MKIEQYIYYCGRNKENSTNLFTIRSTNLPGIAFCLVQCFFCLDFLSKTKKEKSPVRFVSIFLYLYHAETFPKISVLIFENIVFETEPFRCPI
jgi:hypothetical protein